jgi:hypothetical protein
VPREAGGRSPSPPRPFAQQQRFGKWGSCERTTTTIDRSIFDLRSFRRHLVWWLVGFGGHPLGNIRLRSFGCCVIYLPMDQEEEGRSLSGVHKLNEEELLDTIIIPDSSKTTVCVSSAGFLFLFLSYDRLIAHTSLTQHTAGENSSWSSSIWLSPHCRDWPTATHALAT